MSSDPTAVAAEAPDYPILALPVEGVPAVVDTPEAFAATRAKLAAGSGPLAIDTERAQGYRYTAKAYLIQLRREDSGTHLIDPVALENGRSRADLHELADDLSEADWILHAASQDLPCLAEVQLLPRRLFDSELAARLLNFPRVNLGAMMQQALGVTLLKEHSAADWSRRPLPEDWLAYAALDVERLVDLREWLLQRLQEAGKRDWAEQEFRHLAEHASDPPVVRQDPWRRTSGLHAIHTTTGLAVVRELWTARDLLADELDRAPGRLLPDRAISQLAADFEKAGKHIVTRADLRNVPGFSNRVAIRHEAEWLDAANRAANLPKAELPPHTLAADGPPPVRSWERRWPASFERFNRIRPLLTELAAAHQVPLENLLAPDHLRRLLWDSPNRTDAAAVDATLAQLGARPWQRELVVPVITQNW